ncbi:hypothetical protein N7471_013022 [Penicillium samsonianum]|uniref:uncharacterized protein n=1 Tax=Penicillium samsonianum TaxID=1882272 RepID=UPI0025485EB1|nr:uncharacterized protein N7471_013022 [Penicillium samsonianum]KAJ6119071.1 hypothetical protein N7471_013022 [Penicillium samsonianum]
MVVLVQPPSKHDAGSAMDVHESTAIGERMEQNGPKRCDVSGGEVRWSRAAQPLTQQGAIIAPPRRLPLNCPSPGQRTDNHFSLYFAPRLVTYSCKQEYQIEEKTR